MYRVDISQLQPGNRLAAPAFDTGGDLLLPAEMPVGAAGIAVLNEHDYAKLLILEQDEEPTPTLSVAVHSELLHALRDARAALAARLADPAPARDAEIDQLEARLDAALFPAVWEASRLPYLTLPGPERATRELKELDESILGAVAAVFVATQLDLEDEPTFALAQGMLMRDIALGQLPEGLLDRPGPLQPSERRALQEHAVAGFELLHALGWGQIAGRIVVRQHHERLDGSGYPAGVRGLHRVQRAIGERYNIDLMIGLAEIAGVCDTFTALNASRPYRGPWAPPLIRGELERLADGPLSRQASEALLERWIAPPDWAADERRLPLIVRHAAQDCHAAPADRDAIAIGGAPADVAERCKPPNPPSRQPIRLTAVPVEVGY